VTSERDAVLAALTARLDRFTATQDEVLVLNPDAEADARRLEYLGITFVGGMVQVHAYALNQVAWYRWYRFACLPAGEDRADLDEAGRLFHALRPEHPEVGPAQLDDVLHLPEPMTAGDKAAGVYMDASRFLDRYRQTHDRDALDGAINLLRRAGRWMPDEHIRSLIRGELAGALRMRFSETRDRASLDEAIEAARDAVRDLAADDPDAHYVVGNLANALQVRYEHGGDPADLEEAVEYCREALRLAGPEPDPTHLAALANALRRRARRGSSDRDEALRLARAAVAATPPFAAGAVTRRSNLAATLRDQYDLTGDPHDLDQAIEVVREAVGLAPAGHPDRDGVLGNLGGLLGIRHELTADPQDLDGAIEAFEAALPGPMLSDAERAEFLAHLGRSLDIRAEATDTRPDLDRALERLRAAVELTAAQDPKYLARIVTLGDVLMERATRYGDPQDLDEAIEALRAAAASTPIDEPYRGGRYITLSIRLRARALRRRAAGDLDEAIAIAREAVAMADGPGDQAVALANLGNAMVAQFDFGGDVASLDAAVDTGRAAVAACPEGYERRPIVLDQLIVHLKARFDRLGDRADLDEAVQTAREAWPPDAAGDRSIGNLDTILVTRFKEYGAPADLVEAIELQRLAVDRRPKHDRGQALSNLGGSLRLYFGQTGDQSALDEAIGAYRAAVELLAADPLGPVALTQLASALLSRHGLDGDGRDLDAAEAAAAAAVARATGAFRANALVTLGRVLRTSEADGRLDRAAGAFREAMELTSSDHPVHGDAMLDLAAALADRYRAATAPADLEEACQLWTAVADAPANGAEDRLIAASRHGDLLHEVGRPDLAADRYARATELLTLLAWHGLGRPVREARLSDWSGLAAVGAAAAVAAHCPGLAIEILEQGRSVLWEQSLQRRRDAAAVAEADELLARRLAEVRAALDAAETTAQPTFISVREHLLTSGAVRTGAVEPRDYISELANAA
jgi:tetratricopeptide (TPR) repeat protein